MKNSGNAVDTAKPHDVVRMPRLSPQQKLDEERGITGLSVVVGAVRLCIGGPEWQVVQTADVIVKALDKLGFEIVPKVANRDREQDGRRIHTYAC